MSATTTAIRAEATLTLRDWCWNVGGAAHHKGNAPTTTAPATTRRYSTAGGRTAAATRRPLHPGDQFCERTWRPLQDLAATDLRHR
jgi:hypothetical protein